VIRKQHNNQIVDPSTILVLVKPYKDNLRWIATLMDGYHVDVTIDSLNTDLEGFVMNDDNDCAVNAAAARDIERVDNVQSIVYGDDGYSVTVMIPYEELVEEE
jgi:hypothetical protein